MFHDRKLQAQYTNAMDMALVYKLNHYAASLLWRVRDAERMGHKILNREWLGTQYNKRQWTLATKGTRPMNGRVVVDKAPAPDGLEFYGVIATEQTRDREGRTKTVWLIGSVAAEHIEEKLRERDEYLAEQPDETVIDCENDADETTAPIGAEQPVITEPAREAFKRGVVHGRRREQAATVRNDREIAEKSFVLGKVFSDREWLEATGNTGSVLHTCLNKDNKRECIALLVETAGETERVETNPNLLNLSDLLREAKQGIKAGRYSNRSKQTFGGAL